MLVAVVVFFPVTFLFGVSKYLFSALALGVVLALFASYFCAVTVVPLYCAYVLKSVPHGTHPGKKSWGARFHAGFNAKFDKMLDVYERWVSRTLDYPREAVFGFVGLFLLSFLLLPFVGVSFFPRTDAGQFVINVKAPTGTRVELTEKYVERVEAIVKQVVNPQDLDTVVSNIGVKEDHKISSFEYMDQVRKRIATELPELGILAVVLPARRWMGSVPSEADDPNHIAMAAEVH